MDAFSKSSKWIRQPGLCAGGWRAKVQAAPFLRREFDLDAAPRDAKVLICGIGYYELHLNGGKVGDHVLDPGVTQFDKRVRYVVYDVSKLLKKGRNVLGVVLGNGWYNSHTPEVWHFDKAAWRDYPKMRLQLEIAGKPVLFSDEAWKASSGPILFDGLRNGETYDARLELDGWLSPGYDDSAWKSCERVNPPGGVLQEQTMPPCKVMESFQPVGSWRIDNSTVFDFGKGLSGWCKIRVKGEAGSLLQIVYGERLSLPDGGVDQAKISPHVLVEKWHFQTDRYTLKGGGEESWEPRFTYHGFQYAQIFADGEAEILSCEARFVHTAFETVGEFSCSDETLNRLHDCARLSYKGNFVGIPTDCPHREKNGWTGDAQLAVETGLHNFAAAGAYDQWLDSFADVQRPSGQLPGIVPSAGWGFNWGSGPAWDSAFHIIAWNVHLFDGNDYAIKTHYEALKRYVDYCESMADDNIVSFGLGDWAHVDRKRIVDVSLTSTGYYFTVAKLMIEFAKIAGRADDVAYYEKLSRDIKNSFNAKFHKGDGLYADGSQTAQGCALYMGFVEDSVKAAAVKRLVETVEANGKRPDFGILGAKFVPRALAENGHADLAFELITQKAFPGWGYWIEKGVSNLWESWIGKDSLNHIMFGDVDAWMYQYVAGIMPDPAKPAFENILVEPFPMKGVTWAKASRKLAKGVFKLEWRVADGNFAMELEIPEGASASVKLPDGSRETLGAGRKSLSCRMPG